MRNALKLLAPISLLALAACSAEEQDYASEEVTDAAAEVAVASERAGSRGEAIVSTEDVTTEAGPASHGAEPEVTLSLPKMAYVFDYGFRLAADAIAPLQRKHADMCEALGPGQCQIVSLTRTGGRTT